MEFSKIKEHLVRNKKSYMTAVGTLFLLHTFNKVNNSMIDQASFYNVVNNKNVLFVPKDSIESFLEEQKKTNTATKTKPISDLDLASRLVVESHKAGIEKEIVMPYLGTDLKKHAKKSVKTLDNLDWYTSLGMIYQESHFDPKATSVTNAKGPTQLMKGTGFKNVLQILYSDDPYFVTKRKKNPKISTLLNNRLGDNEIRDKYKNLQIKVTKRERNGYSKELDNDIESLKREIEDLTNIEWKSALNNTKLMLDIGLAHFSYLNNEFEDRDLAIAAYNSGEGKVRFLKRVPNLSQTKTHLRHTKMYAEQFKEVEKVFRTFCNDYNIPFERVYNISLSQKEIEKNFENLIFEKEGKEVYAQVMPPGGTMSGLSDKYQIPVDAIKKINRHIKDPRKIKKGDIIYIPKIIPKKYHKI